MEKKRDEVEFKQIAVMGSTEGHWLYGLSNDGEVYQYNQKAALWEPLAMAVSGGHRVEDIGARTDPDSNTSIAQPYRSRWTEDSPYCDTGWYTGKG
jgi:hypothetical protein